MSKTKRILEALPIVFLLFLFGCDSRWDGVYYPEGKESSSGFWRGSPRFETSQECREWCMAQLENNPNSRPDCFCGQNCDIGAGGLQNCQIFLNAYSF